MVGLRRLTRVDTFRSSHKVPFQVMGHIFNSNFLTWYQTKYTENQDTYSVKPDLYVCALGFQRNTRFRYSCLVLVSKENL